jgi:hypothetical protein
VALADGWSGEVSSNRPTMWSLTDAGAASLGSISIDVTTGGSLAGVTIGSRALPAMPRLEETAQASGRNCRRSHLHAQHDGCGE